MAIDHATYCAKVCGAKCCYLYKPHPIPCPRLSPDCTCSIYEDRFQEGAPAAVEVGQFLFQGRLQPFICGRIEDLINAKLLPKDIEAQCCYAHPKLLNIEV